MSDLSTSYLGLALSSPLVASPSPATRTVDSLLALEGAGVGAVVLPSLFEEEVEAEELTFDRRLAAGAGTQGEASGYFPDLDLDHLALDRHLRLVDEAASRLRIPVIASVNGISAGGWVRYATLLAEAGARAIELNMYDVAADPGWSAADVEARYLDLVAAVRDAVDVPLAIKLSPFFTALAHTARRIVGAGADGLVLFNRFYSPDLDLETLDVVPRLELSTAGEMRLPLRWVALLRPLLPSTSLALTTGVRTGEGIAKALIAGADVAMVASEILRGGPGRAAEMLGELDAWLDEHEIEAVDDFRGSVAYHAAADPEAYERVQYHRVLQSWRR